ncbi:MAG: hypothetical protein K8R10_00370, partial [Rhodocyclales bacterium]|nr:hypothetical protein [Rhodocyclales bacterium]
MKRLGFLVLLCLTLLAPLAARADDAWIVNDADGRPQVQLYFFWSLTCPHCTAAHPYIEAIPQARPWVKLHALELSRHPENVRKYQAMARALGVEADGVPAWLFCGEMHVGWGDDETTGATLRRRLDDCRARAGGVGGGTVPANAQPPPAAAINLPLIGALDPASLSLPVLTLVLAGLDAFNPCAF